MNLHQSNRCHCFTRVVSTIGLCALLAGIIAVTTPSFGQSGPEKTQEAPTTPGASAPATPAASETAQGSAAHDAQNPIANVISVPLQNNTYFNAGLYNRTANFLIIEPVIPFHLTEEWNVISRWITPLIYLPRLSPSEGSEFGLGNLSPEFYLSPAKPGKIIWGVGPKFWLPTATDEVLTPNGANKFGGGPTGVALTIHDPWLVGVIANNVWAGTGSKRVNQLTLNPFAFYNMPGGWYFFSSPVITSNWVADSSNHWTVPLGGGFGRVFKISNQTINARVQGLYNVVHPDNAPNWQLQVQVQLLFPEKKK